MNKANLPNSYCMWSEQGDRAVRARLITLINNIENGGHVRNEIFNFMVSYVRLSRNYREVFDSDPKGTVCAIVTKIVEDFGVSKEEVCLIYARAKCDHEPNLINNVRNTARHIRKRIELLKKK